MAWHFAAEPRGLSQRKLSNFLATIREVECGQHAGNLPGLRT